MSIYLVKGLQMSLTSKSIVVGAFATRLLVIPACILRLHYMNSNVLADHRTLANTYVVVCTQLQLGYGIIAVTIPCLRPFLAVYDGPRPGQSTYGYQSNGGDKGLQSFGSGNPRSPLSREGSSPGVRQYVSRPQGFRPDQTKYTATVSLRDMKNERSSMNSHESRQMIIEQKTGWSIEYDAGSVKGATGVAVTERPVTQMS